jgi:hypothetical protein
VNEKKPPEAVFLNALVEAEGVSNLHHHAAKSLTLLCAGTGLA